VDDILNIDPYNGRTLIQYIRDEVRTKQMHTKAIAGEKTRALVEFTNPADKGTKYLMIGDNLWIYFPDEEEVVKISGHMLKEGMMGSDVSYEDALETDLLSGKYDIQLAGEEEYEGKQCFVVTLEANVKDAPYFRRKMWVDKNDYIAWKEQMFAKSGKLLKESNVLEVKEIDGKHFPVKVAMVNKLRKNSKTVFEMTGIEFDEPFDKNIFSLRYLKR
jgi:outer membrane lipoprotein-sorting protein